VLFFPERELNREFGRISMREGGDGDGDGALLASLRWLTCFARIFLADGFASAGLALRLWRVLR